MSRTAADIRQPLRAVQENLDADRKPYRWRVVLPPVLLLAGVSTVFFFSGDRGQFYRQGRVSSHQLSIASNFSLATHFGQFEYKYLEEFGDPNFRLHGRFPPGGFALIKLVTFGFDKDLSMQIYAARMLMLVFFAGTMMLAYWSLCRLTSSRWTALSATALAFSSGYFLYFNDLISTEWIIDLFGCMLVFHGMIIFALEGRFRQLAVKSCIALFLGWRVLAVLMPFIALGLFKDIYRFRIRDYRRGFKGFWAKVRMGVMAATTGRYMVLGIIVTGFSILVLVSNIGHQYYYRNIENDFNTGLFDLSVFESVTRRLTGARIDAQSLQAFIEWPAFLRGQFVRIGLMSIPFALPGYSSAPSWWEGRLSVSEPQSLSIGIVVVIICVIGGFFVRYRLLTMTAVLSGFVWAIVWRYNVVFHHWEALYYVGLPLVLFAMIFTLIRKLSNELFIGSISVIAVLIFGFSSFQMRSVRDNSTGFSAEFHQTMIDDFNTIRYFTKDSSVLVPVANADAKVMEFVGIGRAGLFYYLSASNIVFDTSGCNEDNVDFVPDEVDFIIQTRRDMPGLLTPNNQMVYLYDQYVYEEQLANFIEDNEPLYSFGTLDVYLTGDKRLLYITDRCDNSLLWSRFFLDIVPVVVSDLPEQRRSYGYDRIDFYFDEHYVLDTKRHISALKLPDYDIASIRTGQLTSDGDLIWESVLFGPEYAVTG